MKCISASNRGEAWLAAVSYLKKQPDRLAYNLVVEIEKPCENSKLSKELSADLDKLLRKGNKQLNQAVADTIFPTWEYKRHGARGVYEIYPEEVFPKIKSLPANNWGTYAMRLVRHQTTNGKIVNPLELLVAKIQSEVTNPGPKRSVYEIDTSGGPLSTYLNDADHKRTMGGQCLSHISVKLGPSSEIYLTALYRYQYFIQRALGNFLGLSRLQSFIASEVGVDCGPLVCHAAMARMDLQSNGWGLRDINELISKHGFVV